MKLYRILNTIRKIIFGVFLVLVFCGLAGYGYLMYLDKELARLDDIFLGEYWITHRESTLSFYEWRHYGKHVIDDIKNRRFSLEDAMIQLESLGISVQQMDSIAGDSSWRAQEKDSSLCNEAK